MCAPGDVPPPAGATPAPQTQPRAPPPPYDAPFTFENRTSDKYQDFMEKSVTIRSLAIPTNKEMGAMVHGTNPDRNFYYAVGTFNGDGQNFRNVDNSFDVMGRAWVAPLSF